MRIAMLPRARGGAYSMCEIDACADAEGPDAATQPHSRRQTTRVASRIQYSARRPAVTVSYPAANRARTLVLDVCMGPSIMRGCPP